MPRYFYSKKVEIDLLEIHPTYVAANKYLASDLIKDLTDLIINNRLEVLNVCVIYDQLLKLGICESLIGEVKNLIVARFSEACASNSFLRISENTLVAILSFNKLNTAELELLKACFRWIDSQVPKSKRIKFQRIKHLIRFGDLSLTDFGSISKLEKYMTMEDIASVFLHLSQKSYPIQIAYQSPRGPRDTHLTREINCETLNFDYLIREFKLSFSVNERIRLFSITTLPVSSTCTSLHFQILKDDQVSYGTNIVACKVKENFKSWTIQLDLILQPKVNHKMRFSFSFGESGNNYLDVSSEMDLESTEDEIVFKIESDRSHCIERIAFWPY